MPGLFGYFPLVPDTRSVSGDCNCERALHRLLHTSEYRADKLPLKQGTAWVVTSPAVRPYTAWQRSPDGVLVALQGEVYGRTVPSGGIDEIAAHLATKFVEIGPAAIEDLNGSFVGLIDDAARGVQVLFNDVYASRPIFWTDTAAGVLFSPEIKVFPLLGTSLDDLDLFSFLCYFANGHLFQGQTFFKQVRALGPGSSLTVSNGTAVARQYYHWDPVGDGPDKGEEYYRGELAQRMMSAVERRLQKNRRSVVLLSGGWDSRAILGCVLKLRPASSVQTVSWGIDEDSPGSDPFVARELARHLGTQHRYIRRRTENLSNDIAEMVWRTDGLTDDPAAHHNELEAMREIARICDADTILRGDQVFGEPGRAHNETEALAMTPLRVPGEMPSLQRLANTAVFSHAFNESAELRSRLRREPSSSDSTDRADYWYFHHRTVPYLNRATYYKLTVLELQNPWLDREILDFLQRLPTRYRVGHSLYLSTLRWMFPELMAFPRNTDKGLEDWRRVIATNQAIQSYVRQQLADTEVDMPGWFNPRELQSLVQRVSTPGSDHRIGSGADRVKAWARRSFPAVYAMMKAGVRTHVRPLDVPIEYLVFRVLVAKLWLEMLRRTP